MNDAIRDRQPAIPSSHSLLRIAFFASFVKLASMSAVYCFGEVLWDCMPRGLFLGGAPMNVAAHLARLGCESALVSAVGDDILGEEALMRMEALGIDTRHVGVVQGARTGSVSVKLDPSGNPTYQIRRDVAWDRIPLSEGLTDDLGGAAALVFGSLAMRGPENLRVLEALLDVDWPMRVFDVNLRTPFYTVEQVLTLSRFADLVKCNEQEAREICGAGASVAPEALIRMLADATDAGRVCITMGARGAVYQGPTGLLRAVAPKVQVVDGVGAGDAFLAALVAGIVEGREDHPDFLMRACRLGAYVAASEGAVPLYRASSFSLV